MNIEIKNLTRKIYLTIAIMAVALLLLFWLFTRSFVTIKINPTNSKVTIDGSLAKITAAGVVKKISTPGKHIVNVEASGFIGTTGEFEFGRGFFGAIEINLKKTLDPVSINTGGALLEKGNNFNDSYYLGDSGKAIYRIKAGLDDKGEIKIIENRALTGNHLSGIEEIIWSPAKELALFRKTGGEITLFDFMKYDFVNQIETPWGKDIGAIAWAPDNSRVAYYYAPAGGEKSLIFSNVSNSEPVRVANFKELGIDNPLLSWSPDSEWLLIVPRNSDASTNKVYLFNAYSRTIKEAADSGYQIGARFSPDSNKIIYSTSSSDPDSPITSVLSIMNKDGSEKRSLDLRADLAKTVWEKDAQNMVVATFDPESKKESLFRFDTAKEQKTGFVIKDLGNIYIKSLAVTDDGKVVLYETSQGIFALKVE